MAFVPVANTLMVEVRMANDNQLIENTLYFQAKTDAADPSLVGLGNAVLLWWNASYRVALPNAVSLREIHISDLTTETSDVYTQAAPVPNPVGAGAAPVLPNNVTIAVSFRTSRRGRSFRGRNYFAALAEDQVVANNITGPTAAAIVGAYEDLLDGPLADDWQWGVVSRYSGGAPRAAGIFTPVTSVLVTDTVVDSQRRRLPGRGQ